MAILKEPDGVTFVVDNRPLTASEKKMLHEYIAESKRKEKLLQQRRRKNTKKHKVSTRSR